MAPSCKVQEAHASDIGCICIRLSSSLCCGLASHVRGEAVTQSFRTLLSLLSHQLRISTPLYLPRHFFLLSPFFSISNLPTAHSKHLHPVFATLPAFLHTITRSCAYTHFVRNACLLVSSKANAGYDSINFRSAKYFTGYHDGRQELTTTGYANSFLIF